MDLFGFNFNQPLYPDAPGFKEPTTSQDAAIKIAPRAGNLRERALAIIKAAASTADEIADSMGETVLAIRPRISELNQMGLIEKSGIRRKNASGANAHVWRIATEGSE
jgi:predicted ArsR family transcriptional regulator